MDALRWHAETQLVTPEQKASELLFPREDGGIRTEKWLYEAFGIVARSIGLNKKITPSGMRRTFNDLARNAKVEGVVTKSISGHLTERMREHYSTVSENEQREAVGKVVHLVDWKPSVSTEHHSSGTPSGTPTASSGTPSKSRTN